MSTMCVYCEQLTEDDRAHATQVMRCPLCKTDVGLTAGGVKFRVSTSDNPMSGLRKHDPRSSHRGFWRRWFSSAPVESEPAESEMAHAVPPC